MIHDLSEPMLITGTASGLTKSGRAPGSGVWRITPAPAPASPGLRDGGLFQKEFGLIFLLGLSAGLSLSLRFYRFSTVLSDLVVRHPWHPLLSSKFLPPSLLPFLPLVPAPRNETCGRSQCCFWSKPGTRDSFFADSEGSLQKRKQKTGTGTGTRYGVHTELYSMSSVRQSKNAEGLSHRRGNKIEKVCVTAYVWERRVSVIHRVVVGCLTIFLFWA